MRARQLVALQTLDRRVELVQDQLEPQLRDLVLDDEQHLVVLGSVADRPLRAQQLVELQIRVVAELRCGPVGSASTATGTSFSGSGFVVIVRDSAARRIVARDTITQFRTAYRRLRHETPVTAPHGSALRADLGQYSNDEQQKRPAIGQLVLAAARAKRLESKESVHGLDRRRSHGARPRGSAASRAHARRRQASAFDIAFTSVLTRAIRTLWIVLDEMQLMWIPVENSGA